MHSSRPLLSILGATTLTLGAFGVLGAGAVALGACSSDDGAAPAATADAQAASDAAQPATDAQAPTDGGVDAASGPRITISFEHLVSGTPVTIGNDTPYTNAAGNKFGVSLVRYFISDVSFTYTDDAKVSAPGAHYVDHDTPESRTYAVGPAPQGELASMTFVMGLPKAINVTGAFPNTPESLMEWPMMMGGGYHYMKFEGRYINAAQDPFNFKTHAGPLGGTDYSFQVTLDAHGRTVTADGGKVTLQMNLEQWFTNPNTWDLNDYFTAAHPGIMNNAAAQQSLKENGATVFTLGTP